MSDDPLTAAEDKMREAGVADAAIATFAHYHHQLQEGATGLLGEDEIEPVGDLPALDDLPAGDAPLGEAVVIKLNGGLGTSMGMQQAKSLLEVKDGLTFLDIIVRQVLALREARDVQLPLVLMNSFYTQEDSLAALDAYPDLAVDGVPPDFRQNMEPKLRVEDLAPIEWPDNPDLEWCPPGHGDLYTALLTSGILHTLLERGFRYAFVSNSDNLGAVLDPRVLAWVAAEGIPFLSEQCERTEADKKGGHLAVRRDDGRLVLRETAQTSDEDLEAFQDLSRHRYFNCNNLWIDLRALDAVLRERDGVLGLPLIPNEKTVDPSDSATPKVIQIETAMGAAVSVFDGARALLVPRERFVPVKTTNDLLVLRSDVYELADGARVRARGRVPYVDLASKPYKLVGDFERRFPAGPPSLTGAERLTVEGDWTFGADVAVRGTVTLDDDGGRVDDGTVLEG
jgi:UTP--glucose-1-phosphate uridylyltransferase